MESAMNNVATSALSAKIRLVEVPATGPTSRPAGTTTLTASRWPVTSLVALVRTDSCAGKTYRPGFRRSSQPRNAKCSINRSPPSGSCDSREWRRSSNVVPGINSTVTDSGDHEPSIHRDHATQEAAATRTSAPKDKVNQARNFEAIIRRIQG
jgi:hypothetical protein